MAIRKIATPVAVTCFPVAGAPKNGEDTIARLLGELAGRNGVEVADMLGIVLAAALRAALTQALNGHTEARQALEEY